MAPAPVQAAPPCSSNGTDTPVGFLRVSQAACTQCRSKLVPAQRQQPPAAWRSGGPARPPLLAARHGPTRGVRRPGGVSTTGDTGSCVSGKLWPARAPACAACPESSTRLQAGSLGTPALSATQAYAHHCTRAMICSLCDGTLCTPHPQQMQCMLPVGATLRATFLCSHPFW